MTDNKQIVDALETYIKQARKQDMTDKEIAEKLVAKKYPRDIIERAFKRGAEIPLKPILLPSKMKGDSGLIEMQEPRIPKSVKDVEDYYTSADIPEVPDDETVDEEPEETYEEEKPVEKKKEIIQEKREVEAKSQVQIIEREINLELINEKINLIISILASKQ